MPERREQIMRRLAALRPKIERHESNLDVLYREREALFLEGRTLDPPMIQREMGEASGVTESAVIRTIKRSEARAIK